MSYNSPTITIQSYKEYISVVFNIFTVVKKLSLSISRLFLAFQKETWLSSALTHGVSLSQALENHWSIFFFYFFHLFCNFNINRIIQYVDFSDWLFPLSIFSRLIYLLACINTSFFLWLNFTLLYVYTTFFYPFVSWWTFGVSLFWSYFE